MGDGGGNGIGGFFRLVLALDFGIIGVAIVFIDDGHTGLAGFIRLDIDGALAGLLGICILGGILGTGQAVTGQVQSLAVQFGMEGGSACGIHCPAVPRPRIVDRVLGHQQAHRCGVVRTHIHRAGGFIVGQFYRAVGGNIEQCIIEEDACIRNVLTRREF